MVLQTSLMSGLIEDSWILIIKHTDVFTAKYVSTISRINILQVVLPNEKKISAFRAL